jgi:hypothetical protein
MTVEMARKLVSVVPTLNLEEYRADIERISAHYLDVTQVAAGSDAWTTLINVTDVICCAVDDALASGVSELTAHDFARRIGHSCRPANVTPLNDAAALELGRELMAELQGYDDRYRDRPAETRIVVRHNCVGHPIFLHGSAERLVRLSYEGAVVALRDPANAEDFKCIWSHCERATKEWHLCRIGGDWVFEVRKGPAKGQETWEGRQVKEHQNDGLDGMHF